VVFDHFRAKVGGHVVILHQRFTEGGENKLYLCMDWPVIKVHTLPSDLFQSMG
jgi:hypothetical protein